MGVSNLVSLSPGAVTVAAPWTSEEILVRGYSRGDVSGASAPQGYFSLDLTFTGANRTLAATVLCSNGSTFKAPENATAIFSGKSAGSYIASFSIPVCRAFKIVLTATTDTCTVTECIVVMA